ncbi:MAG: hypothetical protein WDN08_05065 [Rhizomicrobium sp.]
MPVDYRVKDSGCSRVWSSLALSASSLALATAFLATPAIAAEGGGIETVVVTAQFTEQNVQATPLAISVVTAQDLERRGFTNITQLGATVPSLTLNPTPAAFVTVCRPSSAALAPSIPLTNTNPVSACMSTISISERCRALSSN